MKVLHIPAKVSAEVKTVLSKNTNKLKNYRSVGIASTAQHLHEIPAAKSLLKREGKKVFDCGQLLGCDASGALYLAQKVDCFLYIGSGRFHPLAIALETEKPVFVANPLSGAFDEISAEEKQKWVRRRKGRLLAAASAQTLGVLVSTKSGQMRLKEAFNAKKLLESRGKKAFVFAGDLLSPENLMPFKVDAWVNTACPRIVDDEHSKPVVNLKDIEWLGSF